MTPGQERTTTFEINLAAYSDSTRNAAQQSKSVGQTAGYVAGAAAVLAMGTTEAEAAVQIVNVNHVMDPASGELAEFDLDIPGLGHPTSDFGFQAYLDEAAQNNRDWFRMGGGLAQNRVVGSTYSAFFGYVTRLSYGATIDRNLNFIDNDSALDSYLASAGHASYPPSGDWLGGAQGYIGFELDADGVPGGPSYLGWIEVRVDADNGGGEIIRYAINDDINATSMTISEVPEPNSLALLAAGAAGVLTWRRRRKNVA